MPLYEYYCEHNQQILEVRHGMSETVNTWEKLCSVADIDLGTTPRDSEVKRLISGGMSVPRKSVGEVKATTIPSNHSGGCSCC
ncbi:zinc ribbon domain-containing protein [Candidatus Uabimicrobium sp. HlEnr_7]|uniref:zinc ribbon domain-containing protein n=1 Tax=Candidatus Uabimicrobium helgolandensis TaxID=3095367 RepID=UPI0035573684